MRRSTTKEVKEIIKKYIVEHFEAVKDDYNEDVASVDTSNYSAVCDAILSNFKTEKLVNDNRYKAGRISRQDIFVEWCSGLCHILNTSYYYSSSAVDLLGSWLEQTESEKNKYTETEAEYRISSLLYRELLQHSNKF